MPSLPLPPTLLSIFCAWPEPLMGSDFMSSARMQAQNNTTCWEARSESLENHRVTHYPPLCRNQIHVAYFCSMHDTGCFLMLWFQLLTSPGLRGLGSSSRHCRHVTQELQPQSQFVWSTCLMVMFLCSRCPIVVLLPSLLQ